MILLLSIIIPFISYGLQAWPRIYKKNFGVDVWTRLLEADHVRKAHHKIPSTKLGEQYIIDGYFDYPPLFPLLLSFVSKQRLIKVEGFLAPLSDAIQAWLVFGVSYFIFNDLTLSLSAQLFYMLIPMISLENSYLTPRSFGYLNFSLAAIPLIFFFHTGSLVMLGLGIGFSTLIFLSHRFATQSFLFLTLFLTFYLKSSLFIQVFVIGFVLAVMLTKGYYLRVLQGHLANIYFWIKNKDLRFAHQIRGNQTISQNDNDWVGLIYKFLAIFSPIAVFGLNPWIGVVLLGVIFHLSGVLLLPPILLTFAAWVVFFYLLSIVVLKVKVLMPIGEGQRYLEMATVPAVVVTSFILFHFLTTNYALLSILLFVLICLCNLGVILFVQIKGVLHDKNRSLTDELQAVFNYVNSSNKVFRIICIPHQNTTLTLYQTKAQVFVNADNPGLLKITEVYPLLKVSLKQLAQKYNLSHVLVRLNFASLAELKLKKQDIEYQAGDVVLVKI